MDRKNLELRVGITVLIAAVVLVLGLLWYQGFNIRKNTYEIYALFPMVGGITKGDAVSVDGVERGKVAKVTLRDRDVKIAMNMEKNVNIPVDSRVVLQSIGILGERSVLIIRGESDQYLGEGTVLKGNYEPGISEALASLGTLMGDLSALSKDMRKMADMLSQGDDLSETLENMSRTSSELNRLITNNSGRIEAGISSFSRSAGRIDTLLSRNAGRLDSIMISLEAASGDVPRLVSGTREVSEALAGITAKMSKEESSLGALVQNRKLITRLENTVENLDSLIKDIKANPKKYLTVEIF